jgi:hypothetical protein
MEQKWGQMHRIMLFTTVFLLPLTLYLHLCRCLALLRRLALARLESSTSPHLLQLLQYIRNGPILQILRDSLLLWVWQ